MLRRATLADTDVMEAIHAAAFPSADRWSRSVFALQLEMPNVFALLHAKGGMILIRTAADEAEVLTLAVMPDARKQGIGMTLLRTATTETAALGVRSIFLEVSVTNIAARQRYTAAGFVRAGLRRRYYSNGSDALVLRLDLLPHE